VILVAICKMQIVYYIVHLSINKRILYDGPVVAVIFGLPI